jgi:hypothetical protein
VVVQQLLHEGDVVFVCHAFLLHRWCVLHTVDYLKTGTRNTGSNDRKATAGRLPTAGARIYDLCQDLRQTVTCCYGSRCVREFSHIIRAEKSPRNP